VQALPCLCGFYPGICITTEENVWENLIQGSHTIRIHRHNNKNTNYGIKQEQNHIYIEKK